MAEINRQPAGYRLLPEPGMVLLQERICSLRGSKFFPVRVRSQTKGMKWRIVSANPFHSISFHFFSIPFPVLNYAGSIGHVEIQPKVSCFHVP